MQISHQHRGSNPDHFLCNSLPCKHSYAFSVYFHLLCSFQKTGRTKPANNCPSPKERISASFCQLVRTLGNLGFLSVTHHPFVLSGAALLLFKALSTRRYLLCDVFSQQQKFLLMNFNTCAKKRNLSKSFTNSFFQQTYILLKELVRSNTNPLQHVQ